MKHLLVLLITVVFIVRPATARMSGQQYADCAGHYLTAGVVTAIDNDEENKIYYGLLALIAADRSYNLMGYEQSRLITDGVVEKYMDLMTKKQDYMRPLVANIERCNKMASRR